MSQKSWNINFGYDFRRLLLASENVCRSPGNELAEICLLAKQQSLCRFRVRKGFVLWRILLFPVKICFLSSEELAVHQLKVICSCTESSKSLSSLIFFCLRMMILK
jgi:hypothetical protein